MDYFFQKQIVPKLEEDGKQNVSFFIDAYSTEILVSCIGKSLDNDFIEFNLGVYYGKIRFSGYRRGI